MVIRWVGVSQSPGWSSLLIVSRDGDTMGRSPGGSSHLRQGMVMNRME